MIKYRFKVREKVVQVVTYTIKVPDFTDPYEYIQEHLGEADMVGISDSESVDEVGEPFDVKEVLK